MGAIGITRVELPLREPSYILSNYTTIGQLKIKFPKINFVKYIYTDPIDNKMKGANPPDELPLVKDAFPLVKDAYITVTGDMDDIIDFIKKAEPKIKK